MCRAMSLVPLVLVLAGPALASLREPGRCGAGSGCGSRFQTPRGTPGTQAPASRQLRTWHLPFLDADQVHLAEPGPRASHDGHSWSIWFLSSGTSLCSSSPGTFGAEHTFVTLALLP